MHRKGFILIIIIFLVFVNIFPGITGSNVENQKASLSVSKPLPNIQSGDILLVRRSIYNGTIWNYWYWSHCFLYIGSNTFINSCGNGTMCVSALKVWNGDIFNYAHLRVKGNPDISGVIDFALDKLGVPFDYISLFLVTKQLDPPPNHFGYGYYCAELIWASYLGGANIDLDPNSRGSITI